MQHNRGYTPDEIVAMQKPEGRVPKSISFGPNIRKALADGTMDAQELMKGILSTNTPDKQLKALLLQALDAIECADDAFTYFYDTQTDETVFLSDPIITGETNEELEDLIENNRKRFLRFPTEYDIHEYRIMEDFVYSLPAGAARQELINAIICGKGAFRRFKNGIRYHRLEQQWYDYRNQAFRQIAVRWCQDNEIEYTEER